MRLRFKLRHKGWILTTVPMVLGLIFIVVLFKLINEAEVEAESQLKSKLFVSEVTNLSNHIVQAGVTLVMYKRQGGRTWLRRYDDLVAEIPTIFAHMDELSTERKQTQEHTERLRTMSRGILQIMSYFKEPTLAPQLGYLDQPASTPELHKQLDDIMREARLVQSEEAEYQNLHRDEKKRSQLKEFLMFGITANCLLAWAVSAYFSGSVTSRLSVLSKNSRHLAHDEPLSAPLVGDDEIAELDHNFHDMATALRLAQQRKQEFLSMISHDLRTPLSSVIGSLELVTLGRCGEISEDAAEVLKRALRNTDAMLKLVNELLDIDRLESGGFQLEKSTFAVVDLMEQATDLVREDAAKHSIEILKSDSKAQIVGDQALLSRLLSNLLSNALKFSPDGSAIIINVEEKPQVTEVSVIDRGRGIPEEFLSKVFERFQQVTTADARQKGGSGLGLTICKAIAEAHGGSISVKSKEGEGSTFAFQIPREPAAKS